MRKIKEIIIVEGKHDIAFLKTFLEADFIETNGLGLNEQTKQTIKNLYEQGNEFIVLTDPDYPGERIRKQISSFIPNTKHAFVRKELSIKRNKVGVAESTKEEVLKALENVVTFNEENKGDLTPTDLFLLKLSGPGSNINKAKVIKHFHLGHCNSKTLLNRLNLLNVSKEELEKVIDD